jgi:IMP dehydrogenase
MKALSFDDITLVPRFNNIISRKNVDTSVKFGGLNLSIPIFSANMDTITGVEMAKKMHELGGLGFLHRFCSIEDNVQMFLDSTSKNKKTKSCGQAVVSLGVNEGLQRFSALYEVGASHFCIDVAHGHSKAAGEIIKEIRDFSSGKKYRDVYIIAGNVCTPEGAEYLAACGADAIKVGIGPGSVCSTRIKTGFGVPQFTAIQECRQVQCFLIADGGIRTPGDVVKAFAAGADAIMLGGMLSGTDETPGEILQKKQSDFDLDGSFSTYGVGEKTKVFRGMASKEAADDFLGGLNDWKTAEGVEIKVKAKGPVSNVVSDIMGGLRSGMTYAGANNIAQIRERARWREITSAGYKEGTPHGVN